MQCGSVGGARGEPEWNLFDGEEDRTSRYVVRFDPPFGRVPTVSASLSSFDIVREANGRLRVRVENVTRFGCEIVFHTWSDTRVWAATASWIAFG